MTYFANVLLVVHARYQFLIHAWNLSLQVCVRRVTQTILKYCCSNFLIINRITKCFAVGVQLHNYSLGNLNFY